MAWMKWVLQGAGDSLEAFSYYQQGRMDKARLYAEAQSMERNANEVLRAGAEEEASFRKKARAMQGTNIANVAKSGITMTGSPLMVMAETEEEIENEAIGIRRSAGLNAGNMIWQANINRTMGKHAYRSGILASQAVLFKGAAQAMGSGGMGMGGGKSGASLAGSAGGGGASQLNMVKAK